MKRYALFAALLFAACESEDDSDSSGESSPTGASSVGSGETGDTNDDADPTDEPDAAESSGGSSETGDAAGEGGDGTCESFNDMTPYYGDVQVDSFCWTAGLYYACGETGAGDETCGILASFANDGGAACPYC
ncbi:MAG: hypothetical protein ACE37F_02535 [Nannocystaceae bacterium]|nr:hypothetical protein [bacterium]